MDPLVWRNLSFLQRHKVGHVGISANCVSIQFSSFLPNSSLLHSSFFCPRLVCPEVYSVHLDEMQSER